jgi:hypothetical protein
MAKRKSTKGQTTIHETGRVSSSCSTSGTSRVKTGLNKTFITKQKLRKTSSVYGPDIFIVKATLGLL